MNRVIAEGRDGSSNYRARVVYIDFVNDNVLPQLIVEVAREYDTMGQPIWRTEPEDSPLAIRVLTGVLWQLTRERKVEQDPNVARGLTVQTREA